MNVICSCSSSDANDGNVQPAIRQFPKHRLGYFNMDFKDDIELIVSSGKSQSVTFDKSADIISTGLDECDEENATTLDVDTVQF